MKQQARVFIALLAVIGSALAGCTGEQKEKESAKPEAHSEGVHVLTLKAESIKEIGLTTAVAEVKAMVGNMTVPAKLLPNQDFEANVGSLVQGRVREVFVNVGDFVKEGQELMHIEGLEVGEIKSNFIKAKAQLKYAEANYERQKTLLEQKVGSQKAFLETQSDHDKALAEFNAEDKRIHSIGLTDDDLLKFVEHATTEKDGHSGGVLPIKSPIAGTVVERNVVIGQLVDASTTAFRIVNTSTLWADGQVYEKDVPKFSGKPEVTLTVTAFSGEEFRGKVIYVSPVVDEHSRTITIRASIPNRSGRLKPQMFGELHVPIGGTTKGLIVPAECVQKDNVETYVLVATSDTTFERRSVSLGATVDSMVEVKDGIKPGERVVVKGSFQLKSELMKEALEGGE
jgi:cobalt-zinc-cadmium efflux system membrane fusion protein